MEISYHQLFQAIIEQTGEGIALANREGNYVLVNPVLCKMTGYSREELLTMNIRDLIPDNTELEVFPSVLKQQQASRFLQLVRKDGSHFFAEVSGYPVNLENQTLILGIVRDITIRMQQEQAVQEGKRRTEAHLKQTECLHQLVNQINHAQTLEEIYEIAVTGIVDVLNADRSSLMLFECYGLAHFKAWHQLSHGYRQKVDGHCPWKIDDVDAQLLPYESVPTNGLSASLNETLLAEGIGALLFVPLSQPNQLLGKFMVYYDTPHVFTEQELQLAQVIAQNLSAIICRLQALEEMEQAAEALRHTVQALKASEEKIAELAEFNQSIVASAPIGIVTFNKDGQVTSANESFTKMVGSPSNEETLQLNIGLPELKALGFDKALAAVMTNGETIFLNQMAYTSPWGKTITADLKVVPQQQKDGRITGAIIVIDDVTANAQAEKLQTAVYQIAQAADRATTLDELFHTIHKIVQTVMSADNFYIALNDKASNAIDFPYYVDEFLDKEMPRRRQSRKGITEYVLDHSKAQLVTEEKFQVLLRNGEVELFGQIPAIYLGVPLILGGESIGVMTVQHYRNAQAFGERELQMLEYVATQVAQTIGRKQKEIALQDSNRQLQAALAELKEAQENMVQRERLAAVGQLAAGIAHDFNNIMAVIVLYTEMALRAHPSQDGLRRRLETILREAWRATELVQQILDFSRRAVLEPKALELVPFLKEQVKMLERTLPENIRLHLDFAKTGLAIHADPTRIQQIVMNLVVNARDAMPHGGDLLLSLNDIHMPTEVICAACQRPFSGSWIILTIRDNGSGIPAELLPRIFEPFFTTKAAGKGSGLGLSQVAGIVDQHGGHMRVESQVDSGTAFSIYFPAIPTPEPDTLPIQTAVIPKGNQETVLIVEDDQAIRAALADTIAHLNYQVVTAANGQKALALLKSNGRRIDLVLSDLVMPEMGGHALFQEIQIFSPRLPVILLSGYPLQADLQNLQNQGLAGWLQKPPDISKLAQLLSQVLANQSANNQ